MSALTGSRQDFVSTARDAVPDASDCHISIQSAPISSNSLEVLITLIDLGGACVHLPDPDTRRRVGKNRNSNIIKWIRQRFRNSRGRVVVEMESSRAAI